MSMKFGLIRRTSDFPVPVAPTIATSGFTGVFAILKLLTVPLIIFMHQCSGRGVSMRMTKTKKYRQSGLPYPA